MNKCKGCQWYNKPYWSIINPCDNCPNENDNMTIVQIDGVPIFKETVTEEEIKKIMTNKSIFELTIEEKDKEIERLNNIINELEKWAKSIQLTVYRSDGMPVYQHQDVLDKLKELKNGDKDE